MGCSKKRNQHTPKSPLTKTKNAKHKIGATVVPVAFWWPSRSRNTTKIYTAATTTAH